MSGINIGELKRMRQVYLQRAFTHKQNCVANEAAARALEKLIESALATAEEKEPEVAEFGKGLQQQQERGKQQ